MTEQPGQVDPDGSGTQRPAPPQGEQVPVIPLSVPPSSDGDEPGNAETGGVESRPTRPTALSVGRRRGRPALPATRLAALEEWTRNADDTMESLAARLDGLELTAISLQDGQERQSQSLSALERTVATLPTLADSQQRIASLQGRVEASLGPLPGGQSSALPPPFRQTVGLMEDSLADLHDTMDRQTAELCGLREDAQLLYRDVARLREAIDVPAPRPDGRSDPAPDGVPLDRRPTEIEIEGESFPSTSPTGSGRPPRWKDMPFSPDGKEARASGVGGRMADRTLGRSPAVVPSGHGSRPPDGGPPSPPSSDGRGGDAPAAGMTDPGSGRPPQDWDSTPVSQRPPRVKVRPLALLATRGQSGKDLQPYQRWAKLVRSSLDAAGVLAVLDVQPPTRSHAPELCTWYSQAALVVFDALVHSIQHIPTLGDEVLRLQGQPDSAFRAWRRIHAHYFREASGNQAHCQTLLSQLTPGQSSMESFMSRAEALRETWLQYALVLPDTELIVQVFRQLDHSWRQAFASRHQGREPEAESWAAVRDFLLKEDVSRQQSAISTSSPACLPLGYKLQQPRAAAASSGSPPPSDSTGSAAPAQTHRTGPGRGKGKGPARKPSSAPAPVGQLPQQQTAGARPPPVCYFCFKAHRLDDCTDPRFPPGFVASSEAKAKADQIRATRWKNHQANLARASSAQSQSSGASSIQGDAEASASVARGQTFFPAQRGTLMLPPSAVPPAPGTVISALEPPASGRGWEKL